MLDFHVPGKPNPPPVQNLTVGFRALRAFSFLFQLCMQLTAWETKNGNNAGVSCPKEEKKIISF